MLTHLSVMRSVNKSITQKETIFDITVARFNNYPVNRCCKAQSIQFKSVAKLSQWSLNVLQSSVNTDSISVARLNHYTVYKCCKAQSIHSL